MATRPRAVELPPSAWRALCAALLILATAGCGNYSGGSDSGSGGNATTETPPSVDPGGGASTSGVEAFEQTVFPLMRDYCVDCHAGSGPGSPHIAHSDVAVAYDEVVANQKVNLSTPESSRLVRRLVADLHHCWGNCVENGQETTAAIAEWASLVEFGVGSTNVEGIIASNVLRWADGIEDTGAERYQDHTVAFYDFKQGSGEIAYDKNGVSAAMNLTLTGVEWMSNYGIDIQEGGKATASPASSRKLYDAIASPETGSQQYSVEAWVIPANVTQEGPARIVSYSRGTGSRNFTLGQTLYTYDFRNRSLAEEVGNNGTPALTTYDGDEDLQATLQHAVITYDQYRGRRIYVNGQFTDDLDEQGPGRLWSWDPNHTFVLGNETSNDRSWLGKIQLVAVYDHALTEAQIAQNFGAGVGKRVIMRFDISQWIGPGSYLEFVVSEFDEFSYLFCRPTLVTTTPDGFRVSNIRIAINGQVPVAGQAFINVDTSVDSARQELSSQCSVISKDQGVDLDEFSVEFEFLGAFQDPIDAGNPPPPPPPNGIPEDMPLEGIRDFDRINNTMARVTGVDPNSASVSDAFGTLRQQLPGTSDLRTFATSHQVGIFKLALEYCDGMVESNALRNGFFGSNPAFEFDSPVAVAFSDQTKRDRIIDGLVDGMFGIGIANQPSPAEVGPVLNDLIDDLTAACDASNCGADRTRTIVKSACAAVLSSAGVEIH